MENCRNMEVQNNPANSVLNNIVDEDVQLMLWPLNLMQFFSFSPRYCIQNNCISPNNFLFNFFSLIGAIVFSSLYIFRTYKLFLYKNHLGFTQFMTVTVFVDCVYYSVGFVLNFVVGLIQSKNNVKFVLLFQRVHRFLNNETYLKKNIIWNWIIVIVAITEHFVIFSYFNVQLALPWFYFFVNYLQVVFDFNIVYNIRVINMLQNNLELWNIEFLNSLAIEVTRGEDFNRRMFQAYVDILECYNIVIVCFQPFILYYIIEVFLHSLVYIEVTIESLQVGARHHNVRAATLGLVSVLCWLCKDLTWQTMFMHRCETIYLAVQRVRDSCAVTLMSDCSEDKRRLCKNVLRLHRASFRKIRVCGLFYADAAFQLSLVGLLANYSIVLLQFAFL